MIQNYTIDFFESKFKVLKFAFINLLFIVLGYWIFTKNPQVSNPFLNNIILKYLVSILAILMGIVGLFFLLKKIILQKPALTIDEKGLIIDTTIFTIGRVFWENIIAIETQTVQVSLFSKQKFIKIIVNNADEYVAKQSNFLLKNLVKSNIKHSQTPATINTSILNINFDDLHTLLQLKYSQYKESLSS